MKTASQLGISQTEYEALVKVRDGLAAGLLVHKVLDYPNEQIYVRHCPTEDVIGYFNMNYEGQGCGTVACIGGWMAASMGIDQQDYVQSTGGSLRGLFYPPMMDDLEHADYEDITAEMAVKAIDNYLRTGNPFWREVLRLPTPSPL